MKTYDPTEVAVIVGGRIVKSWDTVAPVRDEEGFFFTTGTTGESTRAKNANKMSTITLTLPQSSADNEFLSAFELAGTLIPVSVIDKSGKSLVVMGSGTIAKVADSEFAKEATQREWLIKGDTEVFIVGGNN